MPNKHYDERKPGHGLELRETPPSLPLSEKTTLKWPLTDQTRKVWKDKEEAQ